jgi:ribosomal protein S18 acetylase RimI-like enzyme
VEVARTEGPRGLWPRILGETVYRRLVLLEHPLDREPELRSAAVELTFGLVCDVDELACFRAWPGAEVVRRRLDRGERCFAARHGERLAATAWVATGSVLIPYLGRTLELGDGDAFVYEAYTAPDLRRRGVAQALESRLTRLLRAEGRRRLLRTVLPENAAGVAMHAAFGNRPIGTIGYVKAGPWRHDFLRLAPGSRYHICTDDQRRSAS